MLMKNLRFFLFTFLLLPTVAHTQPRPLSDFPSLLEALRQGEEVRAVIHYALCRLTVDSTEVTSPDAIGGMNLSTFEYFARNAVRNPKAFVSSSETVLINHPSRGHVYNYVKLRIFEDNTVQIIARYLLPGTLEIVMDETFTCTIGDGVHLFID
jgi:hypothetical protein